MAIRDADIKLLFGKNVTVGESINENIANPSQIETGFDILEEPMEIKINKEIRNYKETVYFGLTARQLICSLLAVGTAAGLYFALRGVLDRETLGWLCIVGAAPMAAAGFFHYHGLALEQFLWAWCKTNFLLAGRRLWHSENYLYDLWEKEDKK